MSSKNSKASKASKASNPSKTPKTSINKLEPFSKEWFDKSSSIWMTNKVYLPSKGMTFYYTLTDSPITFNESKTHTPVHPNVENWCKCSYICPDGSSCINTGIIYEDEITIPRTEYDYEKYTEPRFCVSHQHLLKKEIQKRIRDMNSIIEERTKLCNL